MMSKTTRARLARIERQPGGVEWQNLPMILEYDEADPTGAWAGFATRAEAVAHFWRVHRCKISFCRKPEDPSAVWGTPLEGEPDHDSLFLG